MDSKLIPLEIPPGMYRAGTPYQSRHRWYDGSLVRFAGGEIRPVGGWERVVASDNTPLPALTGVPRTALVWAPDAGAPIIAVGTTQKLYVVQGGELADITPAGFTTGRDDGVSEGGVGTYGNGLYGAGRYGEGAQLGTLLPPGTWQLDSFGTDLFGISTSDNKLYRWGGDKEEAAEAVEGAPKGAAVVVTPERFVVVLGAESQDTEVFGMQARLVRWASQEGYTDWTTSDVNTAGEFPLSTAGRLVCGRRTRGETLLFTDADLWAMQYIGGVFVYRFVQVGDQCGIVSPNAVGIVDSRAFWMGHRAFFVYDGYTQPLECPVAPIVFDDINPANVAKVWALPIAEHGEVWWFYPSRASNEIDRYVAYNYREGHWSFGRLARTAGAPTGALPLPLMLDPNGVMWEHEKSTMNHDGAVPYLESGPLEAGDGDNILKVQQIVPDERTSGDVKTTIYTAMSPMDSEKAHGPFPATPDKAAKVYDVRLTGRQIRLRIEEARNADWRIGRFRLGVRLGGRR